jgi:hypothetical protein
MSKEHHTMHVVQIEHPIRDFDTWKRAFDSDPAHREESGVRRYNVYRPIDDPNYIAVDLEFATRAEADAFKTAIERVWRSPQAAPALGGTPRARVVDVVESRSYPA